MGMDERMRAVQAVVPRKTEFVEAPIPKLRPEYALVRPALTSRWAEIDVSSMGTHRFPFERVLRHMSWPRHGTMYLV
jgi:hypothetical protein